MHSELMNNGFALAAKNAICTEKPATVTMSLQSRAIRKASLRLLFSREMFESPEYLKFCESGAAP